MFAQAGHTVQSLPETNYCHSDTEKKKKNRCKYQIAIAYYPFKVLTFPSGSFLPLLLYCHISPIPPSMMSPASIFPHPLLLYINPPSTHLYLKEEDRRENDPCPVL